MLVNKTDHYAWPHENALELRSTRKLSRVWGQKQGLVSHIRLPRDNGEGLAYGGPHSSDPHPQAVSQRRARGVRAGGDRGGSLSNEGCCGGQKGRAGGREGEGRGRSMSAEWTSESL